MSGLLIVGLGAAVSVALAAVAAVLWLLWIRSPKCTSYCDAFRWPHCSDGRCRYHCGAYCQCIPRPESAGELRALPGGKK